MTKARPFEVGYSQHGLSADDILFLGLEYC